MDLDADVAGAWAAQEALEATLAGLADATVAGRSLLPGWTRGHVLAHLAGNADSHVRLLEAARRDEQVDQYEGGPPARAAAIEAGATRPPRELVDDVARSAAALHAAWAGLPAEAWDRTVRTSAGARPARHLVWSRWREVAVHHVDLDLGFTPAGWPEDFVARMLDEVTATLAGRLPDGVAVEIRAEGPARTVEAGAGPDRVVVRGPASSLVAWLFGREAAAAGVTAADPGGRPAALPALRAW